MSALAAPPAEYAGALPYSQRQGLAIIGIMALVMLSLSLATLPMNVLADSIRGGLGIDDVELSLLLGAALSIPTLFSSLAGGWLSDRVSRTRLLTAAMVMWCAGALIGGLAVTYEQGIVGRVIVALGAGMKLPIAMTWLNDAHAPEQRGRAMGAFFAMLGIGPAVSATLAGTVHELFASGSLGGLPLLGALPPWRATILLLAVPSLLLIPLVLSLPDYRSSLSSHAPESGGGSMPMPWALFLALTAGLALMTMLDTANLSWMPTVLKRQYGYDAQQAGAAFGTITMIAGVGGPLLGGWIGDRAHRRYGNTGRLWLCAACAVLCAPLLLAYIGMPPALLIPALTINGVLTITTLALGYVVIQAVIPPQRRGFATGLANASVALVGAAGPTLVALVSEHWLSDTHALGASMAIVGMAIALAAAGTLAVIAATVKWPRTVHH